MHLFLKKLHSHSLFFSNLRSFAAFNSINSSKDYYKILGITKTANTSEIKKTFYSLAKKYHPDVNKGNEEKFKEINEAYEILGDENKRREYDDLRKMTQSEGIRQQQYQNPYYGQNPYGNAANQYNNNNNANQQRYYYYEVKTDRGTYKKSFKQEGPFPNKNTRRDMNLNEEIIQEFMKTFYEGRMNPNQQQGPQKQKMNYSNNNQNNYARAEDFMRQQGFRKDPFSHEYEDYKAYESRKEEELKRQREYERLQKEKQASFLFL